MLMNRLFNPELDQLLFHYCSSNSFKAIIESGKLRFTDINMLNDSMEHRWGYSIFEEAATRLIKRIGLSENAPTISRDFICLIDNELSKGQLVAHPFVSCLSLDGNSLDQWRKYGDDGQGYAIGFKAADLQSLGIRLLRVCYDKEKQIKEMMAALVAIYYRSPELAQPLTGEILEDIVLLSTFMSAMKHPSFASEKEIRCMRAISLSPIGKNFQFLDRGGVNLNGTAIPGEKVFFTNNSNFFTAHVDIPLSLPAHQTPIMEVMLGPKSRNNLGNIFLYLGGNGFTEIKVQTSGIPYR